MRLAAGIVVAGAIGWPATAGAQEDRCSPPRAERIVLDAKAVLVTVEEREQEGIVRRVIATTRGCVKTTGETRAIHSGGEIGTSTFDSATGFRAAGTHVAYINQRGNANGRSNTVVEIDLANGREWRSDEGTADVPALAVNRRGAVAWVRHAGDRFGLHLRRGDAVKRCTTSTAEMSRLSLTTKTLRYRIGDRTRKQRLSRC